jgi:hypothetical protein
MNLGIGLFVCGILVAIFVVLMRILDVLNEVGDDSEIIRRCVWSLVGHNTIDIQSAHPTVIATDEFGTEYSAQFAERLDAMKKDEQEKNEQLLDHIRELKVRVADLESKVNEMYVEE